jgi:hypothetical protein
MKKDVSPQGPASQGACSIGREAGHAAVSSRRHVVVAIPRIAVWDQAAAAQMVKAGEGGNVRE